MIFFFLAGLYTELFDLDDPCWEGDIESATQVYIQENSMFGVVHKWRQANLDNVLFIPQLSRIFYST